jgi:hypothetical protein
MDQAALNRKPTVHVHSHVFTYENRKKGGSAGEIGWRKPKRTNTKTRHKIKR